MVYGVALTVNVMSEDEMAKYPYEIILARIENNALVFIDSTTWDHQKDSKEWFKYTYLGDGVLYERVVPSYEFYFDTPHLISDTFYVGFRRTVPLYQNDDNMMFIMYLSFDSINSMSTEWMCFNWVNWAITDTLIISPLNHYWGGVFPIIQPNRHCSTPPAPTWAVNNSTNTVSFEVPYTPGDSLLLSIARSDQPADSGTIYPVTDNVLSVVIPDSGHYTARLARICQRDIELQSAWSAPSDFWIMNTLGIDHPSGFNASMELYPNPTSRTVYVNCKATDGTIEIMDMQGRTLMQVSAMQRILDVSHLSAGSYFVRLTTLDGTAVRILQVE